MPLFFFIIGFVLIDSGFRGNAQALYQQFASDAKGFVALGAVIIILGALGVSASFRPISKGLLFLVFVVFFVRNGNEIVQGIETAVSSNPTSSPSDSSGSTAMPASATGQGVANSVSQAAGTVSGTANNLANTANSVTNAVTSVSSDAQAAAGAVQNIFDFGSLF